ncbi:palmitoyltransferase [Acrasis kona]|uniref:Palmitoyltransferase n=1 Tax=Acrasis kona TaxID=1008807 RepID=A0AAW2ZJV6_9EUKA
MEQTLLRYRTLTSPSDMIGSPKPKCVEPMLSDVMIDDDDTDFEEEPPSPQPLCKYAVKPVLLKKRSREPDLETMLDSEEAFCGKPFKRRSIAQSSTSTFMPINVFMPRYNDGSELRSPNQENYNTN